MPHATLAICDLNAAVAAKDEAKDGCPYTHTQICLLAQFAKRITGKEVVGSTRTAARLEGNEYYTFETNDVSDLVQLFDLANEEDWTNIAKIRRTLPLNVKYEYDVSV